MCFVVFSECDVVFFFALSAVDKYDFSYFAAVLFTRQQVAKRSHIPGFFALKHPV